MTEEESNLPENEEPVDDTEETGADVPEEPESPSKETQPSDETADESPKFSEACEDVSGADSSKLAAKLESAPEAVAQNDLIASSTPTTPLEIALAAALARKETHIKRLTNEVQKLKAFVSKRKQTYKRKRKDEGAPTRALSAYNIFIQDRFARLAKENENALKSEDAGAKMKRVPPSNLVASTGNEWKELSAEEKAKYEERAKVDRKRYEEQMAAYQPPDKQANRKRNKTGYNMFFSAHVVRLKQSEAGVPSERGSVARIVGNAWKQLSASEKQYYEREADKHNGTHPIKDTTEEEEEEEEVKRQHMEHYHQQMQAAAAQEMHMHAMPAMQGGMHHAQHDPRHHAYYAPHLYGQPAYGHYDYSQHHRHQQARAQGYNQAYPQRDPYAGGL